MTGMSDQFKEVHSQEELDTAIAAGELRIEIVKEITVELRVPRFVTVVIKAVSGALVKVFEGSVEAWGSSSVVARESSRVVARESSSVEAYAASALSLFGIRVSAKATAKVAVHLHDKSTCNGGVQIPVNRPQTPEEWCEWYGVEIHNGHALLYKAVDNNFSSPYGASYSPGTHTTASDWDGGEVECGRGLHFCSTPTGSKAFNDSATKFIACLVPLSEIAVHPNGSSPEKIKSKSCWNHYECDQFGELIGEKFPLPADAK